MAITQTLYTGDGSTVLFSFTFPYLEDADVKVSLDGVDTTAYSLANATTVEFDTAPGDGDVIRIYRDTGVEVPAATFYKGSSIRAGDLNDNFDQTLYIAQELQNNAILSDGSNPFVGPVDLGGYKITNLATPTAATDAATKGYTDAGDALKVNKAGDTMTGNLAMSGNRVTGLGAPSADTDSVTKLYVDQRYGALGVPGLTRWRKIATAGQTVFSGVGEDSNTLTYSASRESVFINGAYQQRGVDYTADDASSITVTPALLVGDVVDVHCVNNAAGVATDQASGVYFTQSGAGALARTVDSKLKDVVSVKDFGAVGDGVTDDTAAIQAALNSATDKVILPTGNFLVNSANLTVPNNTSLVVLGATAPDSQLANPLFSILEMGCLILGNDKTILLKNNAGLKGITIVQEVTYRALASLAPGSGIDATDVANYSGTAIIAEACAYVGYCNIFGFNQGLTTISNDSPRGRLEYLTLDCINGVQIDNDRGGWDLYSCHAYSVLTLGDANNIRAGVGFRFKNYSDWTYVTNCFSFYDIGFRIEDCNSIKFMGCGADHPRVPKGAAGFDIQGDSWGNMFIGCQAASQEIGFRANVTVNNRNMMTSCAAWGCRNGIELLGGNLNVTGSLFRDLDDNGIVVNNANSSILVDACQFQDMPTGIATTAYSAALTSHNEYMGDVVNVRAGEVVKALTLTSSALYPLPNETLLEINNGGQTNLGTLVGQVRDPGSILILKFNDALTLNHSPTGMNLAGSVNAAMTPGSTITLIYVTANIWYEVSRSVA